MCADPPKTLELIPVRPSPITRKDGRLFVATTAGAVELVPSHDDRTKARYWRGMRDGKAVTPWLGAIKIAAAWAVATASSGDVDIV